LHKPKVIVITGLLDQFFQDPYVNVTEAQHLVSQIVTSLHKIKNVLIVLSSRLGDYEMEFPPLSRIIEIRGKKRIQRNETKSLYS
jgi:hypothetical protein